jgi:hypothetical protein
MKPQKIFGDDDPAADLLAAEAQAEWLMEHMITRLSCFEAQAVKLNNNPHNNPANTHLFRIAIPCSFLFAVGSNTQEPAHRLTGEL